MDNLKELIDKEIEKFMDWPCKDNKHLVTTTGAKMFAEHVAMIHANQFRGVTKKVSRPQIREIFLRNGARIEPDRDDLPDWVYESAFELLDLVAPAVQGEAVGEAGALRGASGFTTAVFESSKVPEGTKLYASPKPAEQQPVAWQFYQDGKWWNGDDRIKDHRKNTEEAGLPIRDLYTATQPAEQQPELCKYQPCGCVICTCEHETQCQGCGANHCGTRPVGQFPEPAYQQPAEQQAAPEFCNDGDLSNRCICRDEFGRRVCAAVPAPDVAGLVEALEDIAGTHHHSASAGEYFANVARKAIAAHRGQGGE